MHSRPNAQAVRRRQRRDRTTALANALAEQLEPRRLLSVSIAPPPLPYLPAGAASHGIVAASCDDKGDDGGEEEEGDREPTTDLGVAPDGSGDPASYDLSQSAVGGTWTSMGPAPQGTSQPVSGRLTGIAAHPTDPNTIYVASAGGGVWKTTDAGSTWAPLTDSQITNALGAIAIAPSNPGVIYAGGGEPNNSGDSNFGRGLLKSTDGGSSWTLLGAAQFNRRAISRIVVDPTNANVVYVAVGGLPAQGFSGNRGVWKSTDGGASWTNTTASITTSYGYSDLVINPADPQTLYCAVGEYYGGAANGVYKTTNGGASWSAAGNFGNGSANGRIALALAPSSPSVLYAAVTDPSTYGLSRMMKSTNAGSTWSQLTATPNYQGGQGWYDTTLAVSPTDPNLVYAGGAAGTNSFIRSTNGGTSWTDLSQLSNAPHPDHHALAFDAGGRLLDGNDGGVWRYNGSAWSDLNGNLATIQFEGVALDPTTTTVAYGGSQDNGTAKYNANTTWSPVEGGDGGDVAVSNVTSSRVYHIAPVASFGASAFFRRSTNGGASWTSKVSGITTASAAAFYPPFVLDPNPVGGNDRLLLGTDRVYESVNNADSWTAISAPNTNGWNGSSALSLLAAAPSSASTIYAAAGTTLYVTTNHGATWNTYSVPGVANIGDIAVDPTNASVAYVVSAGFGGNKVFRTSNAGATWSAINGNFPDTPAYALALDPQGPGASDDVLYVGTDLGVYVSTNLGSTWNPFGTGLPYAQVVDLELNLTFHVLAAGTHGRGMWEISTSTGPLPGTIDGVVFNDQNRNGLRDNSAAPAAFDSPDVPKSIPDDSTVTSTLNVPAASVGGPIAHVSVTLSLNHTYDRDLVITLVSPAGTAISLAANVGGSGDNFTNTTFDDAAATDISAASAPFTGTFRPATPLSNFNGQSAAGTWALIVEDTAALDTGTLLSWSISVTTTEPGLAGATVYLDTNANGLFDSGSDPSTVSDASGLFSFPNLTAGNYTVGSVPPAGYSATTAPLVPVAVPDGGTATATFGAAVNLVLYVDAAAPGANNGTSWANAFTSLAAALLAANSSQEIRVADGTYRPTATTDRTISFTLKGGVALYGGYAGYGAPNPDARDIAAYPTVLSGDIGTVGTGADNSYHVITASGVPASAILDGFTVTAGNANGSGANALGGGIYLTAAASPTVANCTFVRNAAASSGGAAYATGSAPAFARCSFLGNTSAGTGGAVSAVASSSPSLAECVLAGNTAANGAAVYVSASTPTLTSCTIAANVASGTGGAAYNTGGAPTLVNCVVWANQAASAPALFNTGGTSNVTYTDAQTALAGTGNLSADPRFYRTPARGADNAWGTADDDYGDLRLLPGSPGVDAGSNAALPAGLATDLAGSPRTFDFPGAGPANSAVVDLGAYELTRNLGALHVSAGLTAALPAGGYAFTATQLIVDPGGTLDLADDSLLVDYAGASPLAAVRSALSSGRNGGAWTGTGITSSVARTTPYRAVGYSETTSLGLTTFDGHAIDGAALLLKYAPAGDANLDGRLTGDDFALADRGRARGSNVWIFGDFDYNAAVSAADLAILDASFAHPPSPAPAAPTADDPASTPAAQPGTPASHPHHAKHKRKAKHADLIQSTHRKAKSPPHAAALKNASRAIHLSHRHSTR